MNLKRLLTVLFLFSLLAQAQAEPAKPGIWRKLKLANGQTVLMQLKGDEHIHFWQTGDGKNYWLSQDNIARPADTDVLRSLARERMAEARMQCHPADDDSPLTGRHRVPSQRRRTGKKFEGKRKGLIILVSFTNKDFSMADPKGFYEKVVNEQHYSEGDFRGSVHDYFYDQSNGKFDLTFDVVGPVKLDSYETYGANVNDVGGRDSNVPAMVAAAVKDVAAQVDFKAYDWDDDNEVEQVYVIYAGRGEATGGAPNTIWPHKYALGSLRQTINGIAVDTYACSNEMATDTEVAGIGTICHEFSHCLGLPDFYDIDYSEYGSNPGTGGWDLMGGGNHNGGGFCPANYTSYEKMFVGWDTPIELTEKSSIENMQSASDYGKSYIIYNKGNQNEYYLLENRQQKGWDDYVPGKGLLVLHVDYDPEIWDWNMPNTTSPYGSMTNTHQRMEVVSAGNQPSNLGVAAYPQGSNNSLSNSTTPKAFVHNENTDHSYLLNAAVNVITQHDDGTISFNFQPQNSGGGDLPEGVLFYESFDRCSGTGGNDDKWTGLANFATADFLPSNEGWTGAANYGANACARFGSTTTQGVVTTPSITLQGNDTLCFNAAPFGNDGVTLTLTVNGNGQLGQTTFTMEPTKFTTFKTTLKGEGPVTVTFTPEKRFFLDEVIVKQDAATTAIEATEVAVAGGLVTVYDLLGRQVYAAPSASFAVNDIPGTGVFVIRHGNSTKKIVK